MIDATLVLAIVITAGLLWRSVLRVHQENQALARENERLKRDRRRTYRLIRRLKRDRDAREDSFQAASACAVEEMARCTELESELVAYRDEARRKVVPIRRGLN